MKLTKKQQTEIRKLCANIDEANLALHNYLQERIEEFEAYAEERSEKWQESDAAQEHQDAIDCLIDAQSEILDTELELDLDLAS